MKRVKLFCFDLDNTLYKPDVGLMNEIRKRIVDYVKNVISIDTNEAIRTILKWRKKYNSTLQGLIQEVGIDEYDYLDYIHNINLSKFLHIDRELKEALNSIKSNKVVLTDSYSVYAYKVLIEMGIRQCFDGVYSTEDMDFFYKDQEKYLKKVILKSCKALELYNIEFSEIMLIDDNCNSLYAAKSLGLKTVYITKENNNIFDYNANNVIEFLELYK